MEDLSRRPSGSAGGDLRTTYPNPKLSDFGANDGDVLTFDATGDEWVATDPDDLGLGETLDQAYDFGGSGAGRSITVDSGAVQCIKTTNDANNAFEVAVSAGSGAGVQVTMSSTASGSAVDLVGGSTNLDRHLLSGSMTQTATSGTRNAVTLTTSWTGSAATTINRGIYYQATVNQTGGSTGSYSMVQLDAVQTSEPSGINAFLTCRGGSAGTTSRTYLSVNGGIVTTGTGWSYFNNTTSNFYTMAVLGEGWNFAGNVIETLSIQSTKSGTGPGIGAGISFQTNNGSINSHNNAIYTYKVNSAFDESGHDLIFWSAGTPTAGDYLAMGGDVPQNIRTLSTGVYGWTSVSLGSNLALQANDTGMSRGGSAGIIAFGNGTAGNASATIKFAKAIISDSGNAAYVQLGAGASAAVGASSTGKIIYNQSTNKLQASLNGASYADIATGSTAQTWAQVLQTGASSGGYNPTITNGDKILFGTDLEVYRSGTKTLAIDDQSSGSVTLALTGSSTIATGTITTSTPLVSGTQTWSSGGTTFTAFKINVTDSASASGSLLADLQVASTPMFNVDKSGNVYVAGKLTVVGAIDPTSLSISEAGNAAFVQYGAGASASVSDAGTARIVYNQSTDKIQVSLNGASYSNIVTGTISTPTWSQVLNSGASSGGYNPTITNGDALLFGSDLRQQRSGSKALTLDDAAGGAADLIVTGVLKSAATSSQIVLQSSGVTGTITWTPATSGKTLTIPNLSGTLAMIDAGQTFTSATWNATAIGEIYGGTNQTSYTIGDTLYASAANTLSKLAGNTTTTNKFLTQTGNGSVSAAPGWNTIADTDLSGSPTFTTVNISASSNQLVLQSGGVTGTITATPSSSNKVWTFPNTTGTVALLSDIASTSGWAYSSPTITLNTSTDHVGIGASPGAAEKLNVTGDSTFRTIAFTSGVGSSSTGGAFTWSGGTGNGSGNAGGAMTFTAGAGSATGTAVGGAITLAAGIGGASAGAGGVASITGGAGTAGNSAGGVGKVVGGAGQGSAAGGDAQVTGGAGGGTGTGGACTITSGAGGATSGASGGITLQVGTVTTSGNAGALQILGAAGVASNNVGSTITITAGNSVGSGAAGSITATAGQSVSGTAGAMTLTAGAGGSSSGAGGIASLVGGAGTAGNSAGGVSKIVGGAGQGTAAGGDAQVNGGAAGATGTGGAVTITAAAASGGNAKGGYVNITGGNANGTGGAAGGGTNDSGNINITGGNTGSSSGSNYGGTIALQGGTSSQLSGGYISAVAGNGTANNASGGSVNITSGTGSGTGSGGNITITSGNGGAGGVGGSGGNISFTTGSGGAGSTQSAGAFTFTSGNVAGSPGAAQAGNFTITCGTGGGAFVAAISGTAGAGTSSAAGGGVTWTAGTGSASGQTGGVFAGIGGTGGSGNSTGGVSKIVGGAGAGSGAGGAAQVTGGAAGATGTGGAVTITGGGSTTGTSGAVNLTTGTVGSAGASGAVSITTANGVGSNNVAGNITITAGNSVGTGASAGKVLITGGNVGSTGNGDGNGGLISITGGVGGSAGQGGYAVMTAGAGGSGSCSGGVAKIIGGAGAGTGFGGDAQVLGGAGGGTSGNGGSIAITAGNATAAGGGGAITITSGNHAGSPGAPSTPSITLTCGTQAAGNTSGAISGTAGTCSNQAGGNVTWTAGAGGSSSGNGGVFSGIGGAGTAGNATGGISKIIGGAGQGSAAGGAAQATGGAGGATGTGGAATITGGAGGATSGVGGAASLVGGAGTNGNSAGGTASVTGGAGQGSADGGLTTIAGGAGGATGAGGGLTLNSGAGGGSSGASGAITIQPGAVTSGNGGAINITGRAGVVSNNTGTTITLTAGASVGSGAGGSITGTAGQSNTGTAGAITWTAGAGGSTSGAGGIASLVGGAGTASNAAGGVAQVTAGAGQGSAAGGEAKLTGGVAGATGTGGAATVTGGAGVAGAGGLSSLVGGAGVGTDKSAGGILIDSGASTGTGTGIITFKTSAGGASSTKAKIDGPGNFILNATGSAIATNATDGFTYVPNCAGTPSGTPATSSTGATPLLYDSTNNVLYLYNSGWKGASFSSGAATAAGWSYTSPDITQITSTDSVGIGAACSSTEKFVVTSDGTRNAVVFYMKSETTGLGGNGFYIANAANAATTHSGYIISMIAGGGGATGNGGSVGLESGAAGDGSTAAAGATGGTIALGTALKPASGGKGSSITLTGGTSYGTDIDGNFFNLNGCPGTGTGAPGSIRVRTSFITAAGSGAQSLGDRYHTGGVKALANNTATTFATISLGVNDVSVGGLVFWTVRVTDSSGAEQSTTGSFYFNAVNTAGTVTVTKTDLGTADANLVTGTDAITTAVSNTSTTVNLRITSNTSLTQVDHNVTYQVFLNGGPANVTLG